MPKGNVDNLLKKDDLTAEQRRENARKAGKASAEKRKRNASIREILLNSFHDAVVSHDKDGNDITGAEFTAMQIAAGIKKGNQKMIELYLAMIGQKPVDSINVTGELKTNKELESIMRQLGGDVDNGED